MSIAIKETTPNETWDKEIARNENAYFLQTVSWGEHEKADGKKVFFLDFVSPRTRSGTGVENNKIITKGVFVERPLAFGKKYLYSPMGPVRVESGEMRMEKKKQFSNCLKIFCKENGYVFARVERVEEGDNPRVLTKQTSPKTSLYIDLSKTEDKLLSEMKQKTRYNIRLAEKKGVKTRLSKSEKDLNTFYEILKETAKRDGIGIYKKEHYKVMLEGGLDLWIAEINGEVLAGAIVGSFNKIAVYLHGGSSDKMRNLMAPYLLQWEAIKYYKTKGFKWYDFWGIAIKPRAMSKSQEKDSIDPQATGPGLMADEQHEWAGITRFKLGFGGEVREFFGARDVVANKFWYNVFAVFVAIKHIFKR